MNAAKLVWSNTVLNEPLTTILSNNHALAVKISKYILGYMRDRYYPHPLGCLNELVKVGCAFHDARDEIYCQLCKQLTRNATVGYKFGWTAFNKCLEYFPPSTDFENYVEYFLRQNNRLDLVLLMHKAVYLGKTGQLLVPNLEMLNV